MVLDGGPLRGLLFLLVCLAIAAAGLIRVFAWGYVRSVLASGWYTTQGRVEFGNVVEHRVRYVSYYVATIFYSYSVNNEFYSGEFERAFLRQSAADRFVSSLKGQMIVIRSHPHRPERSTMLKHDQPGVWAS